MRPKCTFVGSEIPDACADRMKNGRPSHLRLSTEEQVNILLVDDNPAKLLSYEIIPNPLGENLIEAYSGAGSLNHLLRTDVAAIFMDVSPVGSRNSKESSFAVLLEPGAPP